MPMHIDRLILNANAYTQDAAHPRCTAVAIADGRIVACGDSSLRALADRRTQIDDLDGATLLPGLTDAHVHFQWTALSLAEIDLFDLPNKEEALSRVAAAAAKAEPGAWLIGRGWAQGAWPGGAFPTAADLDAVAPNNPVWLRARSGHAAWVNSAPLAAAGITAATPDPEGGTIGRGEDGAPSGILLETAMNLVRNVMPRQDTAQIATLMEEAQRRMWAAGLTGFHDFDGPQAFEAMQLLQERGALGLRVWKNVNDPFIEHAHRLRLRSGFGNAWLRLGGLKIFADGALGPLTAAMLAPYENSESENLGLVVTDKGRMRVLVSVASAAGFAATIHAIGDRAVRDVLDVYEAVRAEERARGLPTTARRHRIEHVQVIHPDDLGRLAALDVIASMQPIHATSDYEMADKYWGARSALAYNARVQLDQGVQVAFGSDSPIEPFAPLLGIHAAVTRRRADGAPGPEGWYPALRLSVDEAVRGFTLGAAYASYREHELGRVAPGYLADLTALDADIYQIAPEALLKVGVVGTMTGGVWRYASAGVRGLV
jgi:hypothetical protein